MILADALMGPPTYHIDQETELGQTSVPGTDVSRFNRGLLNSKDTILSNMIASKIDNNMRANDSVLSMLLSNQNALIELLVSLIEKINGNEVEEEE